MTEPIINHAPRFLLLRGGAIGDFIVTLPVLQALREQWPGADIDIWGYPHIAALAVEGGLAQRVTSLDRAEMARFFVPSPSFLDTQVETIRSFDLIFNYLHDPVGQVRSNLLLAGAKHVLSGSPLIKRGHAIPFLLEPLQALALYDESRVPELNLSAARLQEGRSRLNAIGLRGKPFAIHPGSGGEDKTWPVEYFADIIQRLQTRGEETVLILGEADAAQAAYFKQHHPHLPVLQNLSLTELAGALANCRAYFGNDSGITHLAAALGLPVIALFGPSNPDTWAPRGRGTIQLIQAPEGEMVRLETAPVWAAVENL